jgi:hypothetical protein
MKSEFIEFIGQARKRRSEKFRVQFSVFLICLLLSIFIWSLVRLSKDYYYAINFRLNFINTPGNLKIVSSSDSVLVLKIKLQGFDFFSEEFIVSKERQFDVSLKNIRLFGSGENLSGYLLTNRIGREIVSQSEFPNDVFFVTPDTIFFNFHRQPIRKMVSKPTPGTIEVSKSRTDSVDLRKDTLKVHQKGLKQKNNRNN